MTRTLLICCAALWISFICQSQSPAAIKPSKTILLTLEKGELPVATESCFMLGDKADQIYLVTEKEGKIYIYDNGSKKGPFRDFASAGIRECPTQGSGNEDCSVYYPTTAEDGTNYLNFTPEGETMIRFGGKTFGPFFSVQELRVSEDRKRFTAVVVDEEMSFALLSSSGKQVPLDDAPVAFTTSMSGAGALVAVKTADNEESGEMMNIDFTNITTEELMELAKKMEEQQQEQGGEDQPAEAYLYDLDGKQYGPYDPMLLYQDNPAFTISGGDHWILIEEARLFIDGKLAGEYPDVYLTPCNVWLSSDGLRHAIVNYDRIIFSDGTSYPFPLKVSVEEKNGQTVLHWISFEDEKLIVRYSRPL